MCKRLVLLLAVPVLCLASSAQAANIVWVAEGNVDAAGVPYDQGWIDLLTAQGHTVDDQRGSWMTLTATNIATLEAADLVIVSRTTNSGNYAGDATEVTQWNSVTTPLLLLTAYLVRSNRWQWINSDGITEYTAQTAMQVEDATHPIFTGVNVGNGQIDVIDAAVNSGQATFLTAPNASNGTLIATRSDNGNVWIVEWEPGTVFYDGTSQVPAGKRMLLSGAGGGGAQTAGSMNFTPAGQTIFLNAVAYMLGLDLNPGRAGGPTPEAEKTDVPRDVVLGWQAGENAATHDVYFGTTFADVNNASRANPLDVLVSQGQTTTTFEPPVALDFDQTYYWRVDEWEADGVTMHKGNVWSFTTEPVSYLVTNVTASASLPSPEGQDPNRTVDGSGLDAQGQHSTEDPDCWIVKPAAGDVVWIQFDFDRVYKVSEMHVWNYNFLYEPFLFFGFKDVTVEYLNDAGEWMTLGDFQFAQAPALPTYAGQVIDLGGIAAQGLRITALSNYGGIQYGLSEVQFRYIPAHARQPQPASGATGVSLNPDLTWRAGREAVSHQVSFGTDPEAVAGGTAVVDTTSVASYSAGPLDLGTTYYWMVDEVNEAEAITTWSSDLWSFTTQQYTLVDGFETYSGDEGDEVYMAWADGFEIDNNGSQVGHNDPPYVERATVHSGAQAMPVTYDNSGMATSSEAKRTFAGSQDWTLGGATTLALYFYGDPDNNPAEPMWVRLTDQSGKSGTVTYGTGTAEGTDNQAIAAWHEWSIPLSRFDVNLTRVASMTIGFGGTGPRSSGMMLFDDIRLYPDAPAITPVLAAHWALGGNATDSSGNGNDGTLNGGATWAAAGKVGGALSLNGTDAYVDCGNGESLDITEAITLSAWVNTADANNGEHNPFVTKGDQAYAIKHNLNDQIETFIYDGGWHTATYAIDPSFNGGWHHVASTYDGLNLRLYVDGVLRATTEYTGSIASATYNVNLGRNAQNTDRFYEGLIDEVRIYDGALSAAEVVQLMTP
ncbi:MAG: LamG domain-containing protein [Sedimentisphaerales bacterium]|nr:LamG domain-containing protein [Sedimentisphaerales bacterium]